MEFTESYHVKQRSHKSLFRNYQRPSSKRKKKEKKRKKRHMGKCHVTWAFKPKIWKGF